MEIWRINTRINSTLAVPHHLSSSSSCLNQTCRLYPLGLRPFLPLPFIPSVPANSQQASKVETAPISAENSAGDEQELVFNLGWVLTHRFIHISILILRFLILLSSFLVFPHCSFDFRRTSGGRRRLVLFSCSRTPVRLFSLSSTLVPSFFTALWEVLS